MMEVINLSQLSTLASQIALNSLSSLLCFSFILFHCLLLFKTALLGLFKSKRAAGRIVRINKNTKLLKKGAMTWSMTIKKKLTVWSAARKNSFFGAANGVLNVYGLMMSSVLALCFPALETKIVLNGFTETMLEVPFCLWLSSLSMYLAKTSWTASKKSCLWIRSLLHNSRSFMIWWGR